MFRKLVCAFAAVSLVVPLILSDTSYVSANAAVGMNINGVLVSDEEPKVINQTTFVPIRTVALLPDLQVAWNNKTKTVTVTNSKTQEKVNLIVGNKIASKGKDKISLSSPVRMIDGVTYVPFRFIGEAFGATVKWDNASKSVAIYNTGPSVIADLKSEDLKTARTAALKLPRISFHEKFTTSDESHSTTYYFPYGEVNRFFIINKGVIQYLEIQDNAAWVRWEGVESSSATNKADIIPNIVNAVSKERGDRPNITGKLSYFVDLWMIEQIWYGTIEENGTKTQIGETAASGSNNVILEIPGEQRVN
ncbi:copper amine oxidase N-terminal domain-containing protein [Paenibacillus sp. P96]|uniref:Copper amine oxidase N-terminal domain-containing protein n=1 Tax=Paenibacillus zeirhizosphaerae TaxID=2987519 RepID=A0ABT9FP31_9BACL|nr:copper amine oxidase N-terminal domain-containing protein [Paenibacillus sp. P96]MDP4096266.1 copper amine oxidase N-terminal domain-containing protein [Paenibacillus sp. P96]